MMSPHKPKASEYFLGGIYLKETIKTWRKKETERLKFKGISLSPNPASNWLQDGSIKLKGGIYTNWRSHIFFNVSTSVIRLCPLHLSWFATRHGHFHLVMVLRNYLHFKFNSVKRPSHWVERLSGEDNAICKKPTMFQVLCWAPEMHGLI